MNERIKELAEQAKVELDKDFASGEKPLSIEKSWDEMLKEKFAELIVKECANRATWAQDTGEKDIGSEVLKHFGVEE